jgi:hypothetical protein
MRALVRTLLVILAAQAAILSVPGSAGAAWDPDPTTGARLIGGGANDQLIRASVPDNAGGAVVLYSDYSPVVGYRLMAARISAAGNLLWSAVPLSPGQFASTPFTVVASDGAGGAVLIYREDRGSGFRVYAQRVSVSGTNVWPSGGVSVTNAVANQAPGGVISDGSGGLIASFSDTRAGGWDVYAQRVATGGTNAWGPGGLPVCTVGGDQSATILCTDGAGGAILSWHDTRAGGTDLFAARVTSAGALPWTASGVAVSNAQQVSSSFSSDYRGIVPDGAGGAVFGWSDSRLSGNFNSDLFVERLNSSGAPVWGGGGHPITGVNAQFNDVHVAPDNKGGAFLAWTDSRSGIHQAYVQRVDAAGAPRWATNGVRASTTLSTQTNQVDATADGAGGMISGWTEYRSGAFMVCSQRHNVNGAEVWGPGALLVADPSASFVRLVADGVGGAIAAFRSYDYSTGTQTNCYAQRIDRFGVLGDPAPVIARIRDVSADQGGQLALEWIASYMDVQSNPQIANYTMWRRVPTAAVARALARGARVDQPVEQTSRVPQLRTSATEAQTLYWEYTGSAIARALPGYSAVMATTTDSMPGSNPRTSFMVAAETAGGAKWWFSAPDSGYSVDNIPPGSPGPFTGAYVSGATHLHWSRSSEPDFAGYRVYRGTTAGFPADGAHLIASRPDTGYVDPAGAPYYYKLTAVDAHGNESATALLSPTATTDVPGAAAELELAAPWPNPVRAGATMRFALPAPGRVGLALFDAQGRVARVLANGIYPAGMHSVRIEIRDADGHALESGLYFARLTSPAGVRVRRLVIVE